jgi:hypothetical protein
VDVVFSLQVTNKARLRDRKRPFVVRFRTGYIMNVVLVVE